jgi:hypothetical protein
MRTTVVLDDQVHTEAKALAAKLGISLSRLLEESLRSRLNQRHAEVNQPLRPLPVCRAGGGLRPGLDLDNMKTIHSALDEGLPPDKCR